MIEQSDALLKVILEIRDMLALISEPARAERDKVARKTLRELVSKSTVKAKLVLLMDGSKSQAEMRQIVKVDSSDLSKLVKALRSAKLLTASDNPELVIDIPAFFFEAQETA